MLVDTRKLADEDFIFTSFIGLSRHRNFEAAAGSLQGFHCSRSHQNQCFRLYLIDDQVSIRCDLLHLLAIVGVFCMSKNGQFVPVLIDVSIPKFAKNLAIAK